MMKPPVDHVKVSAKGKEILTQVKRKTGLEHWNTICRVALMRSLANTSKPRAIPSLDTAIEIDWRTFAGPYQEAISALVIQRATLDGVKTDCREELASYFRAHLERGLSGMQAIHSLADIVPVTPSAI